MPSPWQQFRSITVPLVKPTLLYLFVINFVFHFQVFEQIYLHDVGRPGFPPATETVAYRIYSGLTGLRLGQAAADFGPAVHRHRGDRGSSNSASSPSDVEY